MSKKKESAFFKEFREFINRGNMVDLAIGIAVGGSFTTIVNSLVNDIVMPIASLMVGGLDFSTLSIDIPNVFGADSTAHIAVGNFIQNVVNFLSIAFVVFIFVRIINNINRAKEKADADTAKHRKELKDARDEKAAQAAKDNKSGSKTTKTDSSSKTPSLNISIKNPFLPDSKK